MKNQDRLLEEICQSYDLVAEEYYRLFHDEMNCKEYDRLLLDQFAANFDRRSRLCDAGCGPAGHIGRYLFDKGLNIYGSDISPRCIEIARRTNPAMQFRTENLLQMNTPDASLDGLISYYSIIHLPKQSQSTIFREFNRVLKPGGKLLIVVKQGETEGYIHELLGYSTTVWFSHFSVQDIDGYLTDSGFITTFIETRPPYAHEINNTRIYAIGEKL